jgi:signal transduction histidine kinase
MTADDLLLGEVVGHQVASSIDQSLLARRLRRSAALEERTRVSRDLHDGVLQSLTAAALQLETVQLLWDTESRAARDQLAATQLLIANEQRDLRYFIHDSKLAAASPTPAEAGLRAGLVDVAQRLERIWSVRVVLKLEAVEDESPDPLANDICLIVHEAVVNAARHAGASEVRVEVTRANGDVDVIVTDNGRGFPFQGNYNHAALNALQLGPVMLKERVRSLDGTLAIRSTPAGARLDIKLPSQRGED